MAAGVALLLLQLLLFHGECAWNCSKSNTAKNTKKLKSDNKLEQSLTTSLCKVFVSSKQKVYILFKQCISVTKFFNAKIKVPIFVVVIGGLKGMRYVLPEVLINPVLSDSFGFSNTSTGYVFLIIVFTSPIDTAVM